MLAGGWSFRARLELLCAGDEILIKSNGLVGDAGPGEVLLHAPPTGVSHLLAGGRVFEQQPELGGEVAGELLGMHGEAGNWVLLEWNKVAGFAVDNDFEDASHRARDDGGAAGHGFQVDDAEGLVDGRTAEDPGMGVELDGLGARDHLLYPDNLRVVVTGLVHLGAHLCGDLRRVWSTGAEDDLRLPREV